MSKQRPTNGAATRANLLHHALAEGVVDMKRDGMMIIHLHTSIYDAIQDILVRVAVGELIEPRKGDGDE